MRTKNYQDESFLETGNNLFNIVERICKDLNTKMKSESYQVKDIIRISKNRFITLWPNNEPNKLDNKHVKNEYKGIYAFATKSRQGTIDWQYIGISQTIKRRFRGHTTGKTKNDATWAYLMAKNSNKTIKNPISKIEDFQLEHIYPCYFTFVKIDNDMLLHLCEVYCVNKLKSFWNTFKTH